MKRILLPFFCLVAGLASAQSAPVLPFDTLEFTRRVVFPAFALFLLGSFVLGAIKLVLNYLLKNKIIDSVAISAQVVERLLPGPQDEQNRVVKWVALLLSTGAGFTACQFTQPLGLHSAIIMLFSTALGFLAYYLYLRRQPK
jgi:hypothetical protein